MAHPVLWCPKPFFYAIGNTPPACFTKDLSPEESAHVLLLGCGDPRSILYTVHANLGKVERTLDFTCCDVEPAVLARNIILLTLIADGFSSVHCWRIFYHFFLDNDSQTTLRTQCQELLQTSVSITTWNESKYGRYLRFCTPQTLNEVRRHWSFYLETTNLSQLEETGLRTAFVSGMKSGRKKLPSAAITITSMRSSAPVINSSTGGMTAGHSIFESYWVKGTIESSSLGNPLSPHPNALFGLSLAGKLFYPHYASNPIVGYHLAHLYATSTDFKGRDVVECSLQQFNDWCTSFKRRIQVSQTSTVIRIFAGDCLTFCQSLYICGSQRVTETTLQEAPFGVSHISLSEVDYSPVPKAPVAFNIIETSNLIDHLGLLNLLVVTVPILERKPWAVIHTNSLVRSKHDGPASSALTDRAFADIPTLSLLLGVCPSAYLAPFTTHSDKHETMLSVIQKSPQFHEAISWRYPSCIVAESKVPHSELDDHPPLISCDATQLGKFLFSVYLQMFLEENIDAILNARDKSAIVQRINIVHYTRASFAEFLAVIKPRVSADWEKTMDLLLLFILYDKTCNVGRSNYQDLICHMYLRGVYTKETIRWDFVKNARSPGDLFEGWKVVPPVVCIVLEVPRHHMRLLEKMDREEIHTLVIYCELRGPTGFNMQTSIRPTFGRISASGAHDERLVTVEVDPRGWEGDSSLIISFDVQLWILTREGGMTDVDFNLRTTPMNMEAIRVKTGKESTIFSASLTDAEHVYILRYRPNDPRDICPPDDFAPRLPSLHNQRQISVVFDESSTKITTLVQKDDLKKTKAKERLAGGAVVDVSVLTDNALLASFDGYEKLFTFPFPVRGRQRKTRIARRSSYIEVEVPIRPHFENHAELSLNYFPMARSSTSFNLVNMHYVNLDALPTLPTLPTDKLVWLNTHLGLMLSDSERVAQRFDPDNLEAMGMLVNLKESIAHCFLNFSGLKGERCRYPISTLSESEIGTNCIIFINALKLDVAENTVVLDACVVPGTLQNMQTVLPHAPQLLSGKASAIYTLADEMRTWKTLLPSLAERCRTWSHTSACEYRNIGIPASGKWQGVWDNIDSPLCSCGKGRNLGAFEKIREWQPLRSEATRVAIGPLFSFSFLEKSMADWNSNSPSTPSTTRKELCEFCASEGKPKLLVCSGCKAAKYCSAKCQQDHWKSHKKQSKK
ncbi:hypothetical protein CPB83DRAFT_855164 [Crepidotus variabilis]|uniref:MYND-type domain-containing protein n=1 Tax=Crepidotus variabilis TaxID=179855 RepID=A0A9P6EFD3_9AGAR|nr:hypothetical protein CPB83DRAFT_855164 [Crepidotus variabilis]